MASFGGILRLSIWELFFFLKSADDAQKEDHKSIQNWLPPINESICFSINQKINRKRAHFYFYFLKHWQTAIQKTKTRNFEEVYNKKGLGGFSYKHEHCIQGKLTFGSTWTFPIVLIAIKSRRGLQNRNSEINNEDHKKVWKQRVLQNTDSEKLECGWYKESLLKTHSALTLSRAPVDHECRSNSLIKELIIIN